LNDFKIVLWTYQALNFDCVTHNLRYCHRGKSIISTCNHKHKKRFKRFKEPFVLTGYFLPFIIFISSEVSQQKAFYHFYIFVFLFPLTIWSCLEDKSYCSPKAFIHSSLKRGILIIQSYSVCVGIHTYLDQHVEISYVNLTFYLGIKMQLLIMLFQKWKNIWRSLLSVYLVRPHITYNILPFKSEN